VITLFLHFTSRLLVQTTLPCIHFSPGDRCHFTAVFCHTLPPPSTFFSRLIIHLFTFLHSHSDCTHFTFLFSFLHSAIGSTLPFLFHYFCYIPSLWPTDLVPFPTCPASCVARTASASSCSTPFIVIYNKLKQQRYSASSINAVVLSVTIYTHTTHVTTRIHFTLLHWNCSPFTMEGFTTTWLLISPTHYHVSFGPYTPARFGCPATFPVDTRPFSIPHSLSPRLDLIHCHHCACPGGLIHLNFLMKRTRNTSRLIPRCVGHLCNRVAPYFLAQTFWRNTAAFMAGEWRGGPATSLSVAL